MAAQLIPWSEVARGVPDDAVGIFNHIHKTAGTSLIAMLSRHLRPVSYVAYLARPTMYSVIRPGARLIHGHFLADIHAFLPEGTRACYVTFLREPLARAVSHARYTLARTGDALSEKELAHYLLYSPTNNMMVNAIGNGNLDLAMEKLFSEYAFFGIQGEYETSIKGLSCIFPWMNTIARRNVRRSTVDFPVSDAVKEVFFERNRLDVQLYEAALAEFERRKPSFPDIPLEEEATVPMPVIDGIERYGVANTPAILEDIASGKVRMPIYLVELFQRRGEHQKALDILAADGTFYPRYEVPLLFAVGAYERCRRLASAVFFDAQRIVPDNHYLRHEIAGQMGYMCLAHTRLYENELLPEAFARALALYGTEEHAFYYFDWCCAREDGAHLQQYLSLAPPEKQRTGRGRALFHARLGQRHLAHGQAAPALAHALKALEADPWHFAACLLLIQAERIQGRYEYSREILERLRPLSGYLQEDQALEKERRIFDNM